MIDLAEIDWQLDALGRVPDDLVVPMNLSEDIEAIDVALDALSAGLASVTAAGMVALPRSEPPSKGPAERSWPRPSRPPPRRSSTPPAQRSSKPAAPRPSKPPAKRSSRPAPWSDPLAAAPSKAEAKPASKPEPKPAVKSEAKERKSTLSQRLPTPGPLSPLDPARVDAETEALLGEPAASRIDAETDALLSEPPPAAAASQPAHHTDISELLEAELDPSEFPQTPMSPPSLPAVAMPRPPSRPNLDEEGFELLVEDDDILEIVEDDD